MQGHARAAVMAGWNAEVFARTKTLKSLDHYLAEPKPESQQRDEGAAKVLAMMKRIAAKRE